MDIRKLILFFSFLFLLVFLSPKNVVAQVLFEDDFDDGDSNGWIVPRNTCSNSWSVVSNKYGISTNGCITETIPSSLSIPKEINYSFEVDMTLKNSLNDRNFVFKYKDSNNWYGIHIYRGSGYVQKVVNGKELYPINRIFSYNFIQDETYHFRVDVNTDSTYHVYINDELQTIAYDEVPHFDNSSAGLQASGNSQTWFDNVRVTQILPPSTPTPEPTIAPPPVPTAPPTPTPVSLNVESLKQTHPDWKDKNYGYTDKTIGELGCALTSASMVLKYFGHNLNPDELNNWLKSQPDGFIRNSMVNWLAISRYTLIHDSPSSPTLEYTRETATDENILSNLTESVLDFPGIPSIIKTPGHFVVTKSKTTSSFGINDPGYNINELSAYNNLLSLGKYYPSHTNLSYFMFITNPSLTLKIFDELGEEISTQQSFIETPLQILNNTNSFGEELKITILPKPISGNYTLKISGPSGKYLFDAYLYDTSGSVQLDNFVGYLSGYDTDSYNISFTNHKKIDPSKTSIANDLLYGLMNNKFKNFGVFNAIYTQFTKKASLTNLTKQIQSLTPKLIDQEFSSILQVNLTSLVGQ